MHEGSGSASGRAARFGRRAWRANRFVGRNTGIWAGCVKSRCLRSGSGTDTADSARGSGQHVDHGALVAAAKAAGALIVLRFRPGQFVLRGEPLAAIIPAENVSSVQVAIDRGILIGRHRTLTQDSEFGIAQVVEIAIRALSPAVNDTFTGVACVDWLADALLTLAERPPLRGNWYARSGRLRGWVTNVRRGALCKLALGQIPQT